MIRFLRYRALFLLIFPISFSLLAIDLDFNLSTPNQITNTDSGAAGVVSACLASILLDHASESPKLLGWLYGQVDLKEVLYEQQKRMLREGVIDHFIPWPSYEQCETFEAVQASEQLRSNIFLARRLMDEDPKFKNLVREVYPKAVESVYRVTDEWTDAGRISFYSVKDRVESILNQSAPYVVSTSETGNFIEVELMRAGTIKVPTQSCGYTFLDQSVDMLEAALMVNACGNSIVAQKLLNCASVTLDYVCAAFEGVVCGAKNNIQAICHTVMYPVKTAKALGNLACVIASTIPDYIPPEIPDIGAPPHEFALFQTRLDEVRANWNAVHAQAQSWWNGTSTREKIKQSSQLLTEWVLFDKCLGLVHTAGSIALAEVKTGRVAQSMSKFELTHAAPGFALLRECETTAALIKIGGECGCSVEQVEHAFAVLENQVGGCRHKLNRMIKKLEDIEGLERNIKMIMSGNKGNIKGFYFELEAACELIEQGDKIIALGVEIQIGNVLREFDIVTKNKLIECKSWNWEHQVKEPKKFDRLIKSLEDKIIIANKMDKEFVLISKQKIPKEVKNHLRLAAITFLEV